MREIKFRAWYSSTKEMIYGVRAPHTTRLKPGMSSFQTQYDPDYEDADVVMQYTGLKDKNGVEVWEGDLVAFPWISPMGKIGDEENKYSYHGEVIFEDGSFLIKPIKSDEGYWGKELLGYSILNLKSYVIGNIYKNPELLENKPSPPDDKPKKKTGTHK